MYEEEATPEKMQPEGELSVGTSLPYLAGQLVTWLGFKGVRKKLARVPTLSHKNKFLSFQNVSDVGIPSIFVLILLVNE